MITSIPQQDMEMIGIRLMLDTLYLNRTSEELYTTTYNATYDSKITDNTTWNESKANTLYLNQNK